MIYTLSLSLSLSYSITILQLLRQHSATHGLLCCTLPNTTDVHNYALLCGVLTACPTHEVYHIFNACASTHALRPTLQELDTVVLFRFREQRAPCANYVPKMRCACANTIYNLNAIKVLRTSVRCVRCVHLDGRQSEAHPRLAMAMVMQCVQVHICILSYIRTIHVGHHAYR